MNNRFIKICSLLLLVLSNVSKADQEQFRIGLSVWSGYPQSVEGFKAGLAKSGYIEGHNVFFIERNAQANKQKQQDIADEFNASKLDLVYSLTTPGTIIIKETLHVDTPIVFSIVTYPADSGLIESFDYSGNNLVGTSNFVPLKHYIDTLMKLLPKSQSVAIFHRKGEPNSKIQAVNLKRLLKRKKFEVIDVTATDIEDLVKQANELTSSVDVFLTTTDTLMQSGGEQALIEIANKSNIPILSSNKSSIEQGSTFGPVADFYTLGNMSGEMAAQILSGDATTSALESKLQTPPTILINKTQAKRLNIIVPKSLLGVVYVE